MCTCDAVVMQKVDTGKEHSLFFVSGVTNWKVLLSSVARNCHGGGHNCEVPVGLRG